MNNKMINFGENEISKKDIKSIIKNYVKDSSGYDLSDNSIKFDEDGSFMFRTKTDKHDPHSEGKVTVNFCHNGKGEFRFSWSFGNYDEESITTGIIKSVQDFKDALTEIGELTPNEQSQWRQKQ